MRVAVCASREAISDHNRARDVDAFTSSTLAFCQSKPGRFRPCRPPNINTDKIARGLLIGVQKQIAKRPHVGTCFKEDASRSFFFALISASQKRADGQLA